MPDFVLGFGLVAVVLVVTALISGAVERSPLSFPLIFLGLGFLLGERFLGVLQVGPHDEVLEIVATLTLALVLFLDAVKLDVRELGKRWGVPFLILGPGTLIVIGLGAVAIQVIFGWGWTMAFIGGATLASTDPVVLREIVRDTRIPRSVRQVLRFEAGTNDMVVLPIVLVLIAVARAEASSPAGWAEFLAKLLVLGPAIGFAVGGGGSWLIAKVDRHMSVRREYQALYGLGLVLAAYSAATVAGGDGFLGAFAAGIAVVALNQALCDCFLEYGEVTAEVAMLVAFVLFGAVLSSIIVTSALGPPLILAGVCIVVIRPSVLSLVLVRARMSWEARAFIAWFGPRGLNSLLLALLVVLAGLPGAELLLATVGVVVLASVTLHGSTAAPMSAWYGRKVATEVLVEEREDTAAALLGVHEQEARRITPAKLDKRLRSGDPPLVLDVRTRSKYEADGVRMAGSIRLHPDEVLTWALENARGRSVVAYCT